MPNTANENDSLMTIIGPVAWIVFTDFQVISPSMA